MGIESVFRSIAGADFKGAEGGGLSAEEFAGFLKDKAGADGKFVKDEFSKVADKLGLGGDQANNIMDAFGKDGNLSVDKFRDLLEKSAGSDKAFNLDELKGGLDNLADRAEKKNVDAKGEKNADAKGDFDFDKAAGADKTLNKQEFKAAAEKAGVEGKDADKAFEKAAGADGKLSKEEFTAAYGDGKDFASKAKGDDKKPDIDFDKAAGADKALDKDEFKALAKDAGVDGKDAGKAFDKMAGADGKLDKNEFKAKDGMGSDKISNEDFKSKVDDAVGGDKDCGCDDKKADDAKGEDKSGSKAGGKDSDEPSKSGGAKDDKDCGGKPDKSGKSDWSVQQNSPGQAEIKLGDKYTIKTNEADASWTVKNNETGKETKISGDPHVDVGNDGKNDFDFKKDMTYQLDDGTKITVNTQDAGNGTTLSSGLTITNGDNAIEVKGLAPGDKDGALQISQSQNGEEIDDKVGDGALTLDEAGAGWTDENGDVADQALINKAEAAA